jgi:hypothetical protein
LKRLATRSKNREETELQQATPEVQNLQNWKYSANEIIRIKNWANQRRGSEEFSCGLQQAPEMPGSEVQVPFLYLCGTSDVHKQGTLEVNFMSWRYITYVRVCTWHSGHLICTFRSALLQFNFHSIFTSCEWALKNPTAVMKEQKIVKLLASY